METAYPEPRMFGTLPAYGFFLRNVKNIEFGNVEIASEVPDARPAFWLQNVDGADFFRIKTDSKQIGSTFHLRDVSNFRVFGSRSVKDRTVDNIDQAQF